MPTIYIVTDTEMPEVGTHRTRLIEANNRAQALRHVTTPRFTVAPAGALDVAQFMGRGIKVEQASGAE